MLYCFYIENKGNYELKEMLDIVVKKYNNIIHKATKYKPNEVFFSNSSELFKIVLENIKISFMYVGKEFFNFEKEEKCLLNAKIKIKKKYKNNTSGYIIFDRIKHKKYGRIYPKIYKGV